MPRAGIRYPGESAEYRRAREELLEAEREAGQEPRHVDLVWLLWNLLDLTPEGRGSDWNPRLGYG